MKSPQNHCRGYLPHIEVKKLQFLTFRLYDSLPREVLMQAKMMVEHLQNSDSSVDKDTARQREMMRLIDQYEDAGYGQCFLRDPQVAEVVQDTLKVHDGIKYNLLEWCIMPNHVHVLVNVLGDYSLSQILHSWRSYSAQKANEILGRKGQFWMHEYFDRYIRDHRHYTSVVNYIANNPVKAGLARAVDEWRWRGSTALNAW